MPPRGSVKRGQGLRAEARRLDRGAAASGCREAAPFRDGAMLPLRGVPHRIVHRRGARGTVWVEAGATASSCSVSPATRRICDAACAIFSSARPSAISKPRAAARRRRSASPIKRVSVRDQSSRWGSCSTTGVLSYSWRLILAPPFVLDYLAAHEVAHLVEMNHSRRFWRLVERICPTWRARQGAGSMRTAPICIATASTSGARTKVFSANASTLNACVPAPSRSPLLLAGSDRDRSAHDRHVSAVAARHRAAARCLDRAGAVHAFPPIWSALRSGRSSMARCPTGTAASR